jgi:hypothetical protein
MPVPWIGQIHGTGFGYLYGDEPKEDGEGTIWGKLPDASWPSKRGLTAPIGAKRREMRVKKN